MIEAGEPFDLPALTALCARWPSGTVPAQLADDPLLERVRQALQRLQLSVTNAAADLVPLIRHVLLRAAGDENSVPWLRVPKGNGWPVASDWENAQFDVLHDGATLRIQPRWPRLSFLSAQTDLYDDAFKGIVSRVSTAVRADPLLRDAMGLPTYTGDGQREAVRALLHLPRGETLIANLPTGSGKSLLAQLPPLLEGDGLLMLVIVPTVALAIDQAARMRLLLQRRHPNRELPPLAYHGGLESDDRAALWRSLRQGALPILFTSPEYATGSLREVLEHAAANGRVNRVVIDEAHLVIGWGNGFRPAFQLLPALVRSLRARAPHHEVSVVLASATLTGSTIRDLRQLFGPPERTYVVSAVHLRPELRYAFLQCNEGERVAHVLDAVRFAPRPFILYVTRPDEADTWLYALRRAGLSRVDKFSGQTSAPERERLLKRWRANELDGMVATSAFGLGVDKSDVRTVIHATLPDSLDRYYQEVGRAGRDGRAGAALLLYTEKDHAQARDLAFPRLISDERGHERWSTLIDHAKPHETMQDVSWVELGLLPAHLQMRSDASRDWNVRALTLMARARLIELVGLAAQHGNSDEAPQTLGDATHAAIRILDDGHRDPDVFNARMSSARKYVRQAAARGFAAMSDVAAGNTEISEGLRQMYTVNQGAWVPVTVCCGGCPVHWVDRDEHAAYRAPVVQRLPRFARRSTHALDRLALPRAAPHLIFIDVPPELPYVETCAALVNFLAPAIQCHTVALEWQFAKALHLSVIEDALPRVCRASVFIDMINPRIAEQWLGGADEVRILICRDEESGLMPDVLRLSQAHLDIVIIPSAFAHPQHRLRRFIDTTPHVHARDLLQLTTA